MKIKICCIASVAEAELAINAGATTLGLVGKMPSGPGPIADSLIKEIAGSVPAHIDTFLLTSELTSEGIIAHHERTGTKTIQIVDYIKQPVYAQLRKALPAVTLVQVIHVTDESSVSLAKEIEKEVDALLLDSGNTQLATKELGGTGRTHDWRLSQRIVSQSSKPVYLAGGLNSKNIAEAIRTVNPYGIDLCSGVRTLDRLDPIKLKSLFHSIETKNPR